MTADAFPYLKRAPNGVVYIHWTIGGIGARVSCKTRDAGEARLAFGRWLLQAPTDLPVVTVGEAWEERHGASYQHIRTVLRGTLYGRDVGSIGQSDIDGYVAIRESHGVVTATISKELRMIVATWRLAYKSRKIHLDHLPQVRIDDVSVPRDRWLTNDEIRRLCEAAATRRRRRDDGTASYDRGELLLWIALYTGARRGAIEQLTWDRVDFQGGMIRFSIPGRTRTRKLAAEVPIAGPLRAMLERAYNQRINDWVLGSSSSAYAQFMRIAKRAGMPEVTPHTLRHTAATIMARSGVPLFTIAGVLGNSEETVRRVYAKHTPGGLKAAVATLPEMEAQ